MSEKERLWDFMLPPPLYGDPVCGWVIPTPPFSLYTAAALSEYEIEDSSPAALEKLLEKIVMLETEVIHHTHPCVEVETDSSRGRAYGIFF